jgi:hypothetical protein
MELNHRHSYSINDLKQDAIAFAYELGQQLGVRGELPKSKIYFELENNGVVGKYTIWFDRHVGNDLKSAFMLGFRGLPLN